MKVDDGRTFKIDTMTIVNNRAESLGEATEESIELFNDDDYAIWDWMSGNMYWNELNAVLIFNPTLPEEPENWVNGEYEVE